MPFLGGTGTQADPYLVGSLADLDDVRNELAAHYCLVNDIDATDTPGA
jgi:hypothetical protein